MEPNSEQFDFTKAIERLEARARKSRLRVRSIFAMLFVGAGLLITAVAYERIANVPFAFERLYFATGDADRTTLEKYFSARVIKIVEALSGPPLIASRFGREDVISRSPPFTPPSKEQAAELLASLDKAMEDLELATKIADSRPARTESPSSQIITAISGALFTIGAVAFLILLIQISTLFIRYHTRVAELYDAQADALRASNGRSDVAFRLMELLSPQGVEFGKTPTTLYEKALETIKTVAEKSKPG